MLAKINAQEAAARPTAICRWLFNNYTFFVLCTTMLVTVHLQQLGIGLDSAIYASVARNVWENGSWLNPTYTEFYHTPFAEHPPLMFWLQAIVFALFGATDATARLVSIFAGIGSVALTYAIGKRMVDERFGFLSALVLMLTANYLSLCFKTFLEVLFFFCLLLSLFGLVRGSQNGGLVNWLLFGFGLGAAFLTKGVVVAGYLLGLGIFILFSKRELLRKSGFWIGVLIAVLIPSTYLFLEAFYGKNYFLSYYFGQQIFSRALQNEGPPNYFNYTRHLFNLYWPWLPFLFVGIYYAFKRKQLWMQLVALIVLSYALFHSISTRLLWQYYANVYVFGAFVSAFAWHQFPRLQFNHERFKQNFLPIVAILFIIAQALPIRVHELRDGKLLSMTPYAQRIFQTQPRRALFTQKAFGIWSAPAKIKWYWRADAKFALTVEELLQDYVADGRFSLVMVHESELPTLLSAAGLNFQPLVKSADVVLAVQRDRLPAPDNLFDVTFPKEFFR